MCKHCMGGNFFSPPPNKLGAPNRETGIQKQFRYRAFCLGGDNFGYIEPPFGVLKFYNIPVPFDHGSFCSKRNKENGTFLIDIIGYEMLILKIVSL